MGAMSDTDVTSTTLSGPARATSDPGAGPTTIWHGRPDLALANALSAGCAVGHLGIEFLELGDDHLTARMPVDDRTRQPLGLLHGGASVLLAETLVSFAATFVVGTDRRCVGMEINANHLRPATRGFVTGRVQPVRVGRSLHVWNIEIRDEDARLICVSRITIAVVPRRQTI